MTLKAQQTKCTECGYQAITWGLIHCSKCDGKLEILASEIKKGEIK